MRFIIMTFDAVLVADRVYTKYDIVLKLNAYSPYFKLHTLKFPFDRKTFVIKSGACVAITFFQLRVEP